MKTIRLRRPGPCPLRHESQRIAVAAGWYRTTEPECGAELNAPVFAPKQFGTLEGGYDSDTEPGTAVLFVRVMAVREGDF